MAKERNCGGFPYGTQYGKPTAMQTRPAYVVIMELLNSRNFFAPVSSLKGYLNPEIRKYDRRYLPRHTNLNDPANIEWLVNTIKNMLFMQVFSEQTIRKFVTGQKPENLPEGYDDPTRIGQIGSMFKNALHQYALDVVAFQIDSMLKGSEDVLLKDGITLADVYSGSCCTESCTERFRKAVVATLEAVGMDRATIEKGIEIRNRRPSCKWRECTLLRDFANTFKMDIESIDPRSKLFTAFKTYMNYMYWYNHQSSVAAYGVDELGRHQERPNRDDAEACRKYLKTAYSEMQDSKKEKNPYCRVLKTLPESIMFS